MTSVLGRRVQSTDGWRRGGGRSRRLRRRAPTRAPFPAGGGPRRPTRSGSKARRSPTHSAVPSPPSISTAPPPTPTTTSPTAGEARVHVRRALAVPVPPPDRRAGHRPDGPVDRRVPPRASGDRGLDSAADRRVEQRAEGVHRAADADDEAEDGSDDGGHRAQPHRALHRMPPHPPMPHPHECPDDTGGERAGLPPLVDERRRRADQRRGRHDERHRAHGREVEAPGERRRARTRRGAGATPPTRAPPRADRR